MPRATSQLTIANIINEVSRARTKFPNTNQNFTALVEEVGELAQALLQSNDNPVDGNKKTSENVYKEAMQIAAMAIRVMEEGTSGFPHFIPPMV